MLWVLKRTVSMRPFFEHPKDMLKLMGKKILKIYLSNILFIKTCDPLFFFLNEYFLIFNFSLFSVNVLMLWYHLSQCMKFQTMWYVQPAKAQTSLRIRAVWAEPLLVARVFYEC